jgi:rhomboid protease GluP
MKALRKFLADTADLMFALLRLIGLRGPRWEFRKQSLRRRLLGVAGELENVRRGVRARHKMCRECRTLMPTGARVCPECGASTRGIPKGGIGRLIKLVVPGFSSTTSILVSANFAVFLISIILVSPSGERAGGMGDPTSYALWMLGWKFAPVMGPPYWQVYRVVTANFLHGNLIHILMNTLVLMNLGPLVEHLIGRRRFLVLYVVTGVVAFTASALFLPAPSVGASGAIFGLLGFLVVYGRLRGGEAGRMLSSYLMRWVILSIMLVLVVRVDLVAHGGGMAAGAVAALFVRSRRQREPGGDRGLTVVTALTLAVLIVAAGAVLVDWGRNVAVWEYLEQNRLPIVPPPR